MGLSGSGDANISTQRRAFSPLGAIHDASNPGVMRRDAGWWVTREDRGNNVSVLSTGGTVMLGGFDDQLLPASDPSLILYHILAWKSGSGASIHGKCPPGSTWKP